MELVDKMNKNLIKDVLLINKRKNNKKAFLIAISNILLPWIIGILVWKILRYNIYIGSGLLPLTMFYIGTRFRSINNMSHETFHFAFCNSPKINNIYGELFAIFEFSKFKSIRVEHLTHHKYLGDFNQDKDFAHLKAFSFVFPCAKIL